MGMKLNHLTVKEVGNFTLKHKVMVHICNKTSTRGSQNLDTYRCSQQLSVCVARWLDDECLMRLSLYLRRFSHRGKPILKVIMFANLHRSLGKFGYS